MTVSHDILYLQTRKSQAETGGFLRHTENTFVKGANAMKEKTVTALNIMRKFTAENLGFVIVWAAALGIILKLACA